MTQQKIKTFAEGYFSNDSMSIFSSAPGWKRKHPTCNATHGESLRTLGQQLWPLLLGLVTVWGLPLPQGLRDIFCKVSFPYSVADMLL